MKKKKKNGYTAIQRIKTLLSFLFPPPTHNVPMPPTFPRTPYHAHA